MATSTSTRKVSLTKTDAELRTKVVNYARCVDRIVIGRTNEITILMVALLTRSNILMLGPAGEGKSMLASTLINNITGVKTFFKALSPGTDEDEVFGTLIYAEMQAGRVRRNLESTLADCHLAFIDEIYKGSDDLHKSLFTVLNERVYVNGTEKVEIPLISMIAASNEIHNNIQGFNSRFPLKLQCDRLTAPQRKEMMQRRNKRIVLTMPEEYKIDLETVQLAQAAIRQMELPEELIDLMVSLGEILALNVDVDSRSLDQYMDFVKAYTWLDYATVPEIRHLKVGAYALWQHPEQRRCVKEAIGTLTHS
ncbi:AAA family ATPase [Leptolyngbya sp. AN03gr2]|uniref:AAA family ATPase n=1 Tax=unclassified Leptolyngbya TaxID=2650499 RepID=UPI003D32178B